MQKIILTTALSCALVSSFTVPALVYAQTPLNQAFLNQSPPPTLSPPASPSSFQSAQTSAPKSPPAGSNWQHLQQVPLHTRVHVSSDKMTRVCSLDSIDEEKLLCSASLTGGHYVFPRAEIKSVKATRYVVSTAGGAGIGAGTGLIVGSILTIGHGNDNFLNFNGAVRAAFAGIGFIIGAVVGGFTDMFRGPTLYRRA